MKEFRLVELFTGLGAFTTALDHLGIPHKKRICEFDKYAVDSYNAMHGTHFKTSDVTKIHAADLKIKDTDKYTYILTYSFPCQDLSVAGKHKGMKKGHHTRSGLLWEVERLLLECNELGELPQILVMENVPQVHNKHNLCDFEDWIASLEYLGYKSYYQDLNSKDYGIPQSRNRCFMVSILNGEREFKFPEPFELKTVMKDFLEDKVDERYYIKSDKARELILRLIDNKTIAIKQATKNGYAECESGGLVDLNYPSSKTRRGRVIEKGKISPTLQTGNMPNVISAEKIITTADYSLKNCGKTDIANCICARYDKGVTERAHEGSCVVEARRLGNLYGHTGGNYAGNVYDKNKLAPTLNAMQGGNRQPMIVEGKKLKEIQVDPKWIFELNGEKYYIRIRKLTCKECFRLMGFTDEEFEKAEKVNSNTQLYKQAGNSIVVNVLEAIFAELFKEEIEELWNE